MGQAIDHRTYISRAITLAKLGGKAVKSNPLVGCVIVHNDQIIGEGYHRAYGEPHAEINALNSVQNPELLKQSRMYVTLEPCNHQGKTPPCSNAIIASGIRRVSVGCIDPTAKVNGAGISHLRKQGVEVDILNNSDCQALIQPFITNVMKQIPYVILKFAQSSDGFIGNTERQVSLSGSDTNILVHKWRGEVDGILIGTNTAIIDNPRLTTRLYPGDNPIRIVIDYERKIPSQNHIFTDNQPTIVLTRDQNYIDDKVKFINIEDPNNLKSILNKLYKLGISRLLVEGGAFTINHFTKVGLWNEARVITCNKTLGTGVKAPQIIGKMGRKLKMMDDNIVHISNLELKKF